MTLPTPPSISYDSQLNTILIFFPVYKNVSLRHCNIVEIFDRTLELAVSQPTAWHRSPHPGPISGLNPQQGHDRGGSEQQQESHPERWRCEAWGHVEDVGAVPGL